MVPSSWLTAVRTRRLVDVLAALPRWAPGDPSAPVGLRIWRFCGGPLDEVIPLLQILLGANLISVELGQYHLTRSGQRVIARRGAEGLRLLGLALIRAGYFHDQARSLLDIGTITEDGGLHCSGKQARKIAPQLVGIIKNWEEVAAMPLLEVPRHLLLELEAGWALLPPVFAGDTGDTTIRKRIGDRGEFYSYQLERLVAEVASDIAWVARDDDGLGYDIEDRSSDPRRRIEVKASSGGLVRFYLSDNEWRQAHDNPEFYEIQFWGGIDLRSDTLEEFQRLRDQGYPLVFSRLPDLLRSGVLEAIPAKWRITQPAGRA